MDAMKLSGRIVDTYYRKREGSEDYIVQVDFAPNPLDYDGLDEVRARVIRQERHGKEDVLLEKFAMTFEEALEALAEAAGA